MSRSTAAPSRFDVILRELLLARCKLQVLCSPKYKTYGVSAARPVCRAYECT
jgi:hypothetical protein